MLYQGSRVRQFYFKSRRDLWDPGVKQFYERGVAYLVRELCWSTFYDARTATTRDKRWFVSPLANVSSRLNLSI